MSEDLKLCPWCAGPADVEHLESGRWSVGCKDEECYGYQSMTTFARKAEAVKGWNTRALRPAVSGEVEEALAILKSNNDVGKDTCRWMADVFQKALRASGPVDQKVDAEPVPADPDEAMGWRANRNGVIFSECRFTGDRRERWQKGHRARGDWKRSQVTQSELAQPTPSFTAPTVPDDPKTFVEVGDVDARARELLAAELEAEGNAGNARDIRGNVPYTLINAQSAIRALTKALTQSDPLREVRNEVFGVLRRHDVSEQCFAEVAMVTQAALAAYGNGGK